MKWLIPSSRAGALVRFGIAAVVVIALTATTTAVAGLLQFKQITHDLGVTPAVPNPQLTIPDPGNPQTILVVGSDQRFGTSRVTAHTDTMLLVRLDPNSKTINLVSVPRDLKVQIPGHGTGKLNGAYSLGGTKLLVKVLQRQVFPGLRVNHIVDVNFGGFKALVDAIGCVYSDVDERYYNNTAVTDYADIDLRPGYQRLCGANALSFVRFRHGDNDIVRNARQQDFIRWAKDQYGVGALIANRDKLLRIFGAHTQTDGNLHSVDGLINLFNLVAFSAGHSIRQVKFPAILPNCAPSPALATPATPQSPCDVTADPVKEQATFNSFMTPTQPSSGSGGGGGAAAPPPRKGGQAHPPGPPPLTPDPADGRAQAAALRSVGMPVYFPRRVAPGSSYCSSMTSICPVQIPSAGSYPRAYQIRDEHGVPYAAYRMTVAINPALGQYYGVQGTTWQKAPILSNPNQTRTVNGKRLALYLDGHKITLVAWRTPQGVYWIANSLSDLLSNPQMLGIAASLTRAP